LLIRWTATENVRWKTPLPERGNSTPIVWGDRVFVTQAIDKEGRRTVICFDRTSGKQLWQSGVAHREKEETHPTNPYCSASPVTDGTRVIAWFGSAGVVCYDFAGKELWRRDLGKQSHEWGYAASPVLYENLCILNFGPGDRSFLTALDKRSGDTVWHVGVAPPLKPNERTDGFAGRDDGYVGSWSTPILVKAAGRDELLVSLPEQLRAFDPRTGKEQWSCKGLNPLIYTSPIYGDGVVVAMGGFLGTTIAVRPGGEGDVTGTHRLWQTTRTRNRLGSGVVHAGHLYILNTEGIVECVELKTGKAIWEERLKGQAAKSESWSSMVLVGDKIYIPNQSSETYVLRASPKFELLSVNSLDGELTNASLAVSDGELFVRTHKNLWCIAQMKATDLR
jgi:outer membrane protein assembly factor BamB